MRLLLLALIVGIASSTTPAYAAGLDAAAKAEIDRRVEAALRETGTPSASIAVVQDGRIADVRAYGLARLSPAMKATPTTRYQIASLSKELVAAAALIAQEDGKLSLDDVVGKWLPALTGADKITVRQLLTHTSGYSDYWPQDYLAAPMERPVTIDALLAAWAKRPLDFAPGTDWQYSNTGYAVAGRILELATGQPLAAYVEARVLRPVGVTDAADVNMGPLSAPDAQGYERPALGPLRPVSAAGRGWAFGAWQFALTAGDLARWDLSLVDRTLLKPESYAQEFTAFTLKGGRDTHYGLGLAVRAVDGRRMIRHGGEGAGYLSENRIYPDDKAAVVVLTNTMSGDPQGVIADRLAEIVLPRDPLDARMLGLFTALQHGAVDRAAFTDDFNAWLNRPAAADYARKLGPLGPPELFHRTGAFDRGGMKGYGFRVVAGGKALDLSIFVRPDGKVEQFLVSEAAN
jgi:D-alanyl-D-alanine carboxypeptidase